ncbi:MAG: hypothetical protein ABUL60_02745 [Myxococcales bacterium]
MREWISFFLVGVVALGVTVVWIQRLFPANLNGLLTIGLVLRAVGSTVRLKVLDLFYSGFGDSTMYFAFGSDYARSIADFDFRFVFGPNGDHWWGTQAIHNAAGFVIFFTGESLPASFLVFSLFSFTGLLLCVRAYGASFGEEREWEYARWLWLWPTLWFWPSSIGKESLMLLAAGLTVYGYVGKAGSIRWIPMVLGITIAATIRPHVGAVLAASVVTAEYTGPGTLFTPKRVGALLVALAITGLALRAGLAQLGLEDADLEGVQEHFEMRSVGTMHGGSQIELATGWKAVPVGLITILMRPFPWEARGIQLLSALEIWTFWGAVVWQRKSALAFLSAWRTHRILRFALPFTGAMALVYGMAFANLGIIARQRAVILPFMLLLVSVRHLAPARGGVRLVPASDPGQILP